MIKITYAIKIEEMTLFCEDYSVSRNFLGCDDYEIITSIKLKEIYFKSLEDVLKFCQEILKKAKIIETIKET